MYRQEKKKKKKGKIINWSGPLVRRAAARAIREWVVFYLYNNII